jgi:phosphonopyruvate decarboxylase
MIEPAGLVDHLGDLGISFYTGVPDSLLKEFCAHVTHVLPRDQHVIAANEGNAIAIAMGHYLRTGTPAVVYLQNSGFGNTVNPLLSLADPEVYGIPMVIVVGWRGQPGGKDEPQHVKQGRIMAALLDALEFPWAVLPKEAKPAEQCMTKAVETAISHSCPYLVLVERGTFAEAAPQAPSLRHDSLPSREAALVALTDALDEDVVIVSTTGMLSRELFEYRQQRGLPGERDFLTFGGMGNARSIALGIALHEPAREVWCFDGDGALLMHMGSLAVIADHAPFNFRHVIFNNGVHDSVGGQPTSIGVVDAPALARASGYRFATTATDLGNLDKDVAAMREHGGPSLLEIRVRPGNRPGIGRPTRMPTESKQAFMAALR